MRPSGPFSGPRGSPPAAARIAITAGALALVVGAALAAAWLADSATQPRFVGPRGQAGTMVAIALLGGALIARAGSSLGRRLRPLGDVLAALALAIGATAFARHAGLDLGVWEWAAPDAWAPRDVYPDGMALGVTIGVVCV